MTAEYFFTNYVEIPNWRKKMSGKNSNGNPVDFTEAEKKEIAMVWEKYTNDLNNLMGSRITLV